MRRIVAVAVLGVGGCSWLGVRGPRDEPRARENEPLTCTEDSSIPVVDTVAAVPFLAAGALLLVAAAALTSDPTDHGFAPGVAVLAVPPLAIGGLYAASAHHGVTAIGECREAKRQRELDAAAARKRDTREKAWQLTQAAATAARANDCATVKSLDAQVRGADLDFHDTVFARDVAIAACLAP